MLEKRYARLSDEKIRRYSVEGGNANRMNCEEAQERWHQRRDEDRADADPDRNPDHELDAHIASCQKCRAYDAEMRLVAGALDELAAEPLPQRETTTRVRPTIQVYGRLFRVAAMIALLVGASWWITNSMPPRAAQETETKIVEAQASDPSIERHSRGGTRIGLSLRGESAGKYLALRRPTSVSNVQLYWLYPIVATNADSGGAAYKVTPGGV